MDELLRIWGEKFQEAAELAQGEDSPEGTVNVQISKTLALKLSKLLRLVAAECESHGSPSWWLSDELEEMVEALHR